MIRFDKFHGGKRKAVTMSYDDAMIHDKRLVDIFNNYGIKGTFHINSGLIGKEGHLTPDEIKKLYYGHEVAVHGVLHQTLTKIPPQNMVQEVIEDRRVLERIVGYPVTGMSYANGAVNDEVCAALHSCGIVYSRTTRNTDGWSLPEDFLRWHPTCHHKNALSQIDRFINFNYQSGYLMYIWGHSFEFDKDNNWELIEEICQKLGGNNDIWYATNIEIYNYVQALKSLVISVDEDIVTNPTMYELWFSRGDETVKINPCETLRF